MENQPKPSEAESTQQPSEPTKPVKEKKPRTPAQEAATAKALAAMTAARKAKAEKQIAKKEEVKKAKKVVEDKILKEDIGFVMKNEYESKTKELMGQITELKAMLLANKQTSQTKTVPERIVERVVEKHIPTQVAQPTKLSGHALLDKLFFDK